MEGKTEGRKEGERKKERQTNWWRRGKKEGAITEQQMMPVCDTDSKKSNSVGFSLRAIGSEARIFTREKWKHV